MSKHVEAAVDAGHQARAVEGREILLRRERVHGVCHVYEQDCGREIGQIYLEGDRVVARS